MGAWVSPIVETLAAAFGGLLAFVLAAAFALKALPFSVERAFGAGRNPAVAVVIWSVLVGLGIIVAAAATPGG
ncbi:MAG: hypothetical protein MUF34_04455 [Polyangiaceae bacterium]|jgi:uncharacterized membrane protein YedE/YeeE|nr:hypothetical protein [Polyangiaceae bacterium]